MKRNRCWVLILLVLFLFPATAMQAAPKTLDIVYQAFSRCGWKVVHRGDSRKKDQP